MDWFITPRNQTLAGNALSSGRCDRTPIAKYQCLHVQPTLLTRIAVRRHDTFYTIGSPSLNARLWTFPALAIVTIVFLGHHRLFDRPPPTRDSAAGAAVDSFCFAIMAFLS
jgi:hypothetical protein